MKITPDIIQRVESGRLSLYSPCVICGGALVVGYYVKRPDGVEVLAYDPRSLAR